MTIQEGYSFYISINWRQHPDLSTGLLTIQTSGPNLLRLACQDDYSDGGIKSQIMKDLTHLTPHSVEDQKGRGTWLSYLTFFAQDNEPLRFVKSING